MSRSGLAHRPEDPANPAGQYNGLLGGNPDLIPEKATTKTVGVVLQPRFLPRFAFTVDYWNIDLKKAIQGFGADAILQDCIDNTTDHTNPAFVMLVHSPRPIGIDLAQPAGLRDRYADERRADQDGRL